MQSVSQQIQDGAYARFDERYFLTPLRRHRHHFLVVCGVYLGDTGRCRPVGSRHRPDDAGVLGELAGQLCLPGRVPRGRPRGAAGRPGGRLLRRLPRRDTDQAAAAPARRRQRSRVDRQPGDARVAVVVSLECRVVSESKQHVDHLVRSTVFSQPHSQPPSFTPPCNLVITETS